MMGASLRCGMPRRGGCVATRRWSVVQLEEDEGLRWVRSEETFGYEESSGKVVPMVEIMVKGCLADFEVHGCFGGRMRELAVAIMVREAPKHPKLPERLRDMDPEDLGDTFLLDVWDKDHKNHPDGDVTSWDKVLLKDGATDVDMVKLTHHLVNNWLVDQFKQTPEGKLYECLRSRMKRDKRFKLHHNPSAWGLAGGPEEPTAVPLRELKAAVRGRSIVYKPPKNPDGTRSGNLGKRGEVEAAAAAVLTAAQGIVEQSQLFSIIGKRIVGYPLVDVITATDWGGGSEDFDMGETLDRARRECNGRRVRNGGLEEA